MRTISCGMLPKLLGFPQYKEGEEEIPARRLVCYSARLLVEYCQYHHLFPKLLIHKKTEEENQ